MELIIVTGLSGAGKSCVVKALEDTGSFCIDNLPVKLIPVFAKLLMESGEHEKIAVVTDIRAGLTAEQLRDSLQLLKELDISYKLLFLDCSEDELLVRYKFTRRLHPLMNGDNDTLISAISREKSLLAPVKEISDYVIDTSFLSFTECKERTISLFRDNADKRMYIHFMSFGYKHGIPQDADYVLDVRFLPNPFYVPELKELTGLDKRVRDYVMESDVARELEKHFVRLIELAIPECVKDGRGQLVVAVGCTGGHHRSITFAERLNKCFKEKNYHTGVSHRDVNR